MCFVAVALGSHPEFSFVVAANRDEYFDRPARVIHTWDTTPKIYAGQDLTAGGTWLGISTSGEFAALTNCRSPDISSKPGLISRGQLVRDYLLADPGLRAQINQRAIVQNTDYGGFNLIAGTVDHLHILSNVSKDVHEVNRNIRVLSNRSPDGEWPKTQLGAVRLGEILETRPSEAVLRRTLFEFLANPDPLTDTQITSGQTDPLEMLQRVIFVRGENYGTRASTVILIRPDGTGLISEKGFGPLGQPLSDTTIRFQLRNAS